MPIINEYIVYTSFRSTCNCSEKNIFRKLFLLQVEGAFSPNFTRLVVPGSMALRLRPGARPSVRSAVKLAATALSKSHMWQNHSIATPPSCWFPPDKFRKRFAQQVHRFVLRIKVCPCVISCIDYVVKRKT